MPGQSPVMSFTNIIVASPCPSLLFPREDLVSFLSFGGISQQFSVARSRPRGQALSSQVQGLLERRRAAKETKTASLAAYERACTNEASLMSLPSPPGAFDPFGQEESPFKTFFLKYNTPDV